MSHLSHSVGQDLDNFFMGSCHHTLIIDLNDAMAHSYASSFSNATTHKATNLMDRCSSFFRRKTQLELKS